MNIRTKIKNKRRQKEIKRYYKKPSLAKIILIRGIVVLLIFAIIMTVVVNYMHTIFIDNNERTLSTRFNLFKTRIEKAYDYYISQNDPDYFSRFVEELGHEPTDEEINDQYTHFVRRWLNLSTTFSDGSVNLYDENFENGIMNFDKPYLSFSVKLDVNPDDPRDPSKSFIYYTFQNDEMAEILDEIKMSINFDRDAVVIHMDGYYVKGTEFIPKDLYFGANVTDVDNSPNLNKLFRDGELYEDIEYGSVDIVIHIDTGCGTKEEMEAQGYQYIDSNIHGYFGILMYGLTPIYPISSQQIESQEIALNSFDHEDLMNTTQTTEGDSISYDSSIDTWGIEYISSANIVRTDPTDTTDRLNLVYRYEVTFWEDIGWYFGFSDYTIPILGWEITNKNLVITGCLISGLLWIIITAILSALAYQKKKNTYEMNIYQRDLTNIMAHDLKSPLMVIRGSAENLQDNESNEYTQTIINEADYMSTLISRILSLSKLEANQEKMKSEEINFKEITEKLVEKYSEETDRRSIKVAVKESDSILKVKGDSFWISEALSNLFDNAVKYSPNGSEIKIELKNKSISIRNKMSDPDINEKELEKLKKSFMRGDNSRSGQSGNGLGLTIAENILTRNHMNLTLKKDGDDFIATIE
ncbi:MAG: HAMP domain-containing histidine kinase [Eubacterium sp.]|nr:HAMP domain-containing histidine kinase [Eubacterium sp.]